MSKPEETGPVERVDDPDLEAALDELEHDPGKPAGEVMDAMDEMIRAIAKAVA
jgi:hypothetical protein